MISMILVGGCRDLLVLQAPMTNFVCKFPCLLKLPPSNMDRSASFLTSSYPLNAEAWFRFHPGTPEEVCEPTGWSGGGKKVTGKG